MFFHPMEQIEVASGKLNMVTAEAKFTRLESELSFLQVRSTMTLQETIRQVKAEICEDRKQIAHTRLESIAGAENPYSLMQVFGRGHQVTRNGATVYMTRCRAAEVLPRTHTNCTNEIQAILNDASEVQRRRAPEVEVEWAMVLRIPGDQGLCRAGEDPHEAHRHRRHQGYEPWTGQEYLQSCTVGGVCVLPGEPRDAPRIPG